MQPYSHAPSTLPTATTLVEVLRQRSQRHPETLAYTFLIDGETATDTITYSQLEHRSRAIGATLQEIGATNQQVLLLYPSSLDYITAFLGCLYAGAIAVPMYPPHLKRATDRLLAVAKDAQARFALTTTALLNKVEAWSAHTPQLATLRWLGTDTIPNTVASQWQLPSIDGESLAFLQYTSGSTAAPKGVMVSHANLMHNHRMLQQAYEQTEQTVYLSWLPLFHDLGLIGNVLQSLYLGAHCILMPPLSFLQRPGHWLQAISTYQATTSGGPNFAYDLCVDKITDDQLDGLDLSHWDLAFNGAEPIRPETLERFVERFGPHGFRRETFYPCYGLAEATLMVSGGRKAAPPIVHTVCKEALAKNQVVTVPPDTPNCQTLVGCGHARLDQRILIVDPQHRTQCAPDAVGEIWVSGPSVAHGYWQHPMATAETFQARLADTDEGLFLRTGDMGFLSQGELFITGRVKDVMIIRGSNHYPQDIELTVEQSHPSLRPTCGAAFTVDIEGEERLVVVQEVNRQYSTAAAALDRPEITRNIRQAIAETHGLQVHAIVLLKVGSIPKTSSGKIQRQACKAGFATQQLSVIEEWHTNVVSIHKTLLPARSAASSISRLDQYSHPTRTVTPGTHRQRVDGESQAA